MIQWSRFPKQIEVGLRSHYHDARIDQWHNGEMTSRDLLVLIEGLPDDSEYKRALKGYPYGVDRDWSKMEYFAARQVAETAANRGDYDETGLVSPVEDAVSTMKKTGTWPPEWWPEKWKQEAVAVPVQVNEPVTVEHYDAVHNLMLDQLYGRS